MNRSILIALAALSLVGCGDDDMMPIPDGGSSDTGGGDAPTCEDYCMTVTTNCTGGNAQYMDMAACMTFCQTNGVDHPDPMRCAGPRLTLQSSLPVFASRAARKDSPSVSCSAITWPLCTTGDEAVPKSR